MNDRVLRLKKDALRYSAQGLMNEIGVAIYIFQP